MIRDSTGNVMADAINVSKFYGDVACYQYVKVLWGCSICKSRCCASWGLLVGKNAGLASLIIETASQMVADLLGHFRDSRQD